MPTFPTNPTITSRIAQGTELSYVQMDTNFGNLTASNDAIISVIKTGSYLDSNNVYYLGTSQSFDYTEVSSSTIGTLEVTNLTANGTVAFNSGITVSGGSITADLVGTASYSNFAIVASTSSISSTASLATTASYAKTSSWAVNSTYSDYALTSTSASYALTATSASYALTATSATSATTATSASYALNANVIASGSGMALGQLYYIVSGSTKVVCIA